MTRLMGVIRRTTGRGWAGLGDTKAVRVELHREQRHMLQRILEGCRRRRGCGTRRHRAINAARYRRCRQLLDAIEAVASS